MDGSARRRRREAVGALTQGQDSPQARLASAMKALMSTWMLVREAVVSFFDESPFQHAAAISFYTLLSLSPLVLVVVGLAGLVWSEQMVGAQLLAEIERLVGPAGAETVETILAHAADRERSLTSVVIGFVTLVVGATTVFGQLQASINHIWGVKAAPSTRVIWSLIRTRLLSLALVLVLGFLLLVSLLFSAALTALHDYVAHLVPAGADVWRVLNLLVSLGVATVLIALIFKFLPDVEIGWRYVWFGAVVTSALFGVGRFLIGFYLGHTGVASTYGAAGSLVVFLLWVYYSSLILLFGAEVTEIHARRAGAAIVPAPHAVAVAKS